MSRSRKLIQGILNKVHAPIGRHNLQRRIRRNGDADLWLEIGAWTTNRPGWTATDVSWRASNFLDLSRPWPIPSGSTMYVFADNVVEHLSLKDNRLMLREAFRVLKSHGTIRLVTPDIESLVQLYLNGLPAADALHAELTRDGYLVQHSVDLLRFAFQDDGHHDGYLWDLNALGNELTAAGFSEVRRCDLGQSNDPNLRNIDGRSHSQIGKVMLIVEATKH